MAVTDASQAIFMRNSVAPADSDVLSISADGSSGEIPLAATAETELYGGLTSDGRVVCDGLDVRLESNVESIFADGSGGAVPLAFTAGL